MGLNDAVPAVDQFSDTYPETYLTKDDRSKSLSGVGIPSEPVLVFHPGGGISLIVDKSPQHAFTEKILKINWKVIE